MSRHKDEKWLDDQLQRAVNGTTPVFDPEAWKRQHSDAYEALLARGRQTAGRSKPHRVLRVLRGSFGKIAVAAVVMIVAGVLLVGRKGAAPDQRAAHPQQASVQSPGQMLSMISLSTAFRRGGMEGLDRQCDRALERLGPRPNRVSMHELLKDINGLERERTSI